MVISHSRVARRRGTVAIYGTCCFSQPVTRGSEVATVKKKNHQSSYQTQLMVLFYRTYYGTSSSNW